MTKRSKISIVGAGNVGATLAQRIAEKRLADIVLVDIVGDLAAGKALDMLESAPILKYDVNIVGTDSYEETAGSDIVVITAGIARKPGMDREELFKTNAEIVKTVTEKIVSYSPETILLIVSNPLDAMAYIAYQVSGFPRQRVIGMAGVLDAARMAFFIADELNVSVENIHACVFGGHGDTMVPSVRYTTVAGIPVKDLIGVKCLAAIIERTRKGGAEIVKLLKTGSAYYAPSTAGLEMVKAILLDTRKILPCSVFMKGEYGFTDHFLGVPVKLGKAGVIDIIDVQLEEDESSDLHESAKKAYDLCRKADLLLSRI